MAVQFNRCTDQRLYRSTDVQINGCTGQQMYRPTAVQINRCTNEMYRSTGQQMYRQQLYRSADVQINNCCTNQWLYSHSHCSCVPSLHFVFSHVLHELVYMCTCILYSCIHLSGCTHLYKIYSITHMYICTFSYLYTVCMLHVYLYVQYICIIFVWYGISCVFTHMVLCCSTCYHMLSLGNLFGIQVRDPGHGSCCTCTCNIVSDRNSTHGVISDMYHSTQCRK